MDKLDNCDYYLHMTEEERANLPESWRKVPEKPEDSWGPREEKELTKKSEEIVTGELAESVKSRSETSGFEDFPLEKDVKRTPLGEVENENNVSENLSVRKKSMSELNKEAGKKISEITGPTAAERFRELRKKLENKER